MPLTILPKLLLQIFDRIVSPLLHFEKRKILLLTFHGLFNNIRAFSLTFWVFWAFWNDKRKIEKQPKNEIALGMLTSHVDGKGYVEKRFFGCVAQKLKQKIKFRPATLRI